MHEFDLNEIKKEQNLLQLNYSIYFSKQMFDILSKRYSVLFL